jgi:hypothetical protein
MLTRLWVAAGGVAVASLSNHGIHRVHAAAAAAPESAGVKSDKSESKGDNKSDSKSDTAVKASKAGDADIGAKKIKTSIKASELPIYGDPEPVTFELIAHKPSAYFTAVSDARKFVWTYRDTVQNATKKVCESYEWAKKSTKDGLQYIQKDSGVVPRAVFISVAGLGGIVAGYRGGFFRKTVYASIAMASAASVCYPDQAVAISKKSWITVRDFTSQAYKDNVGAQGSKTSSQASNLSVKSKPAAQSTNKVENTAAMSETKPDNNNNNNKPVTTTSPSSKQVPITKDFGQSNKEDKDMYSTRGSK